jgi:hypothetical protein
MKRFKNFDILTDREQDVIRVMHLGMKDTLGLSPDYFQDVLHSARVKLGMYPDSKITIGK